MATIFKRGSTKQAPAAPSTSLAGFNLQDLADEGRGHLDAARQQAEQILAEARAQADQIRDEAKQQGYEAGLQLAIDDADVKLQAARVLRTAWSAQATINCGSIESSRPTIRSAVAKAIV